MNTFLKRLFVISIGFVIILALRIIISPYHIGNPNYSSKLHFFESNENNFNSVVFGSSRMYRQVNPTILDSILSKHNFSTYNFASPATYNPESYFLFENFIENVTPGEVQFAYLELQNLNFLDTGNANTTKGNYWNTLSVLRYCLDYIDASDYPKEKKGKLKEVYLKSFMNRLIDFSSLNNLLKSEPFMNDINGFYSLEQEILDKKDNDNYYKRDSIFHSDYSLLNKRITAAKTIGKLKNNNVELNEIHRKYLLRLISKSQNKGIHLVFVLPPRLDLEFYKELIPIINSLPKSNTIELASFPEYKEFYKIENSFDSGHLNILGARLFSEEIAKKTKEILELPTDQIYSLTRFK